MKIWLVILSWWCFSCLHIQRIGIQHTDQLYASMLFLTKYESNFVELGFCSRSHYSDKIFSYICGRIIFYGWTYKYMRSNIYHYITTLSLFNFLRNSQHPKKWSVSFNNFFRKRECISCYLSLSSNLQFQFKKGIFRNSL